MLLVLLLPPGLLLLPGFLLPLRQVWLLSAFNSQWIVECGGDGREEQAMLPSCETLETKPAPAAASFRPEAQWDDSIYVSPVAVAVFFAIQYAGYSPSRALQLSGITSSISFKRMTT